MLNKKPLVSIITPCYNSEVFIHKTIESVLEQSYDNWEMLITDDGSTDNSVELITNLSQQDDRIKLFKIMNSGAAVARNNSIKHAKGVFIAFLDIDDLWLPKKLELQIKFMLEHNYLLTYTSYQRMSENGVLLNKIIEAKEKLSYNNMLTSNKIGCLTAVYNQEVLGKVYMPLIRKRQDYALWLKILKKIDFAYGLNEVLSLYRLNDVSMSSNKIEMLKWNWKLFKQVENKNFIVASFLVLCNVISKIRNL